MVKVAVMDGIMVAINVVDDVVAGVAIVGRVMAVVVFADQCDHGGAVVVAVVVEMRGC